MPAVKSAFKPAVKSAAVKLKITAVLVLLLFALSGCVLTMPKPFLKERNPPGGAMPDLSGRWKDEEGQPLTVEKTGVSNTFSVYSQDKDQRLKVTMERLDDKRFILQFQPPDEQGGGVFLTVGEVDPRKVVIYTFPEGLPDLRSKAKANGVVINEFGLITKYERAEGIIQFFREMADAPGHVDLVLTK
ncbi:MAG: hypothetical protein LBR53_03420 [Deltaproteobacteria bacterium]|jgi:hypothetical protein|nr:hypothetical protein [Deltaproteobacteria bacterium]